MSAVMRSRNMIHLWAPELAAVKGGIQTYSAFLLRGLQEIFPSTVCHVFLKNDARAPAVNKDLRYTLSGSWPKELRNLYFAFQAGCHGLTESPDLIISTHVHFAKLAYYLKKITGTPY